MNLHVTVNNEPKDFVCQPTDTLLGVLRREGYSSWNQASATGPEAPTRQVALAISVAVSGGPWAKSREPQIILKTDQRNVILELGLGENSKQN